MNISSKIKNLRKSQKLTQAELALKANISRSYLADIERNRYNPSVDTLKSLANALDVPLDYLTSESLYEIVLKRLDKSNTSIEQLAKKANVSVSYINNLDTYNCPDESDYERVGRIAIALDLQPNVLKSALMRQESPVHDNKITSLSSADFEPVGEAFKIDTSNLINIPIVGSVRAGEPILAQDNIESYQPTLKDTLCSDKDYFYLRVQGDSMNLEFTEGSLLLIEKASWVENGSIAVVLIDGMEATVKKVIQNENMITLIPMSTNPEHVPHMYDVVKDKISIVGRVKQAIKNY